MDNQFQVVIHQISTDTQFRSSFLNDFNSTISEFSLTDEEMDVLLSMRSSFLQLMPSSEGVADTNGPFGWHGSRLPEGVADTNGPFGWHGSQLPEGVADTNGPFGWHGAKLDSIS